MAYAVDPNYQGQVLPLVLRPAVARKPLTDYFEIVEGIKDKQIVNFIERGGLATIVDPGCGQGQGTITLGRTSFTWDPVSLKAWIAECEKDLNGKAEAWMRKTGNDRPNLLDTDYWNYMVDVLEEIVGTDLTRMSWFADPAMVSATLTPSVTINGVTYTNTQLLNYFKTFKGIWKRIFDGVTATTIKRITIAQNDTATDQTFPDNAAAPLFRSMIDGAPAKLTARPTSDLRLMVTRSIYNAYVGYREGQNLDMAYVAMGEGQVASYRGIPLLPVDEWSQNITTFFRPAAQSALAGKQAMPNRAILTVDGVLQLGFDATPVSPNGRGGLELFYDQTTELTHAKTLYRADAQIADPELIVVAY